MTSVMKIFVINLPESTARRAHIDAQLGPLDVDYVFFEAVNGNVGRTVFDECDDYQFFINNGRVPSPGEIGCFASHRSLWQKCVQLNQPILILEDDAAIGEKFKTATKFAMPGISRLRENPALAPHEQRLRWVRKLRHRVARLQFNCGMLLRPGSTSLH